MGIPKPKQIFTVAEYLALEREALERSEYLDGEVFAMAGEGPGHGDVTANLAFLFVGQLKGKPCRARFKDTKVRSGPSPKAHFSRKGLYSYPDMVVICGEPEYHDEHGDIVLNPAVIVEVLSPSTESFDRGEKFRRYQTCNPTLSDYLLVAQDRPEIEHFSRQADEIWKYQRFSGLEAVVALESIGCTLKLADVYDRIVFPKKEKPKKPRRRKPRR